MFSHDHYMVPALQRAGGDENRGAEGGGAVTLPNVRADDQVGRRGFVFESDERDALGC